MSESDVSPKPTLINPPGLYDPAPNGYSHVALVPGGTRLAFIAGQGGETVDGRLSEDFRDQVRQERLGILGDELARAFGAQMKPACTLIPVPRLALDGMLFEVDAVVVLPEA